MLILILLFMDNSFFGQIMRGIHAIRHNWNPTIFLYYIVVNGEIKNFRFMVFLQLLVDMRVYIISIRKWTSGTGRMMSIMKSKY